MTQTSPGPLGDPSRYEFIESWLLDQCNTQPPGTRLPSEKELAEKFSVSRMTARQAMARLTHSGQIVRRQGVGTFIGSPGLHRRESELKSFTQEMRHRGLVPSSDLLEAGVFVDPVEALAMGLRPNAWLVRIDRVRKANNESVALEHAALPIAFRAVLDADLEAGSLHERLREMGVLLTRAQGSVSARLATDDEARILGLNPPAALLVESRLIYDDQQRIIERTETAYVASRWAIDTSAVLMPAADALTP